MSGFSWTNRVVAKRAGVREGFALRQMPEDSSLLGCNSFSQKVGALLPQQQRTAKLRYLFYQLNQLLRQECEVEGVRPKSEVGKMPPTLGLSSQLARSDSPFLRLQATKCTPQLAFKLLFDFIHASDVATARGQSSASHRREAGKDN